MTKDVTVLSDRMLCRQIVDRLRDGQPPSPEAIGFLSVGHENHLARIEAGLVKATTGGYDSVLLEGKYGIGKSHLLGRVEVLAEAKNFVVRRVPIGSGVYLNDPDGIYRLTKGDDPYPGYRYYWRGDRLRKFVGELKALTEMHVKKGKSGLALLLDEMENTFHLARFPSRAKAYRILGALFKGRDNGGNGYFLELGNTLVVIAITPGTVEQAMQDGWWLWGNNPAHSWSVPDRCVVEPLDHAQATELVQRIRKVHSVAFDWNAVEFVSDTDLERLCREWHLVGDSRDERQLIKRTIALLELAEQNR